MEFSLGKSISSGTMLPSFLSREALDHAYEVLEATDGSGVNFVDFLLFMEEFKPQICKFNYFESLSYFTRLVIIEVQILLTKCNSIPNLNDQMIDGVHVCMCVHSEVGGDVHLQGPPE